MNLDMTGKVNVWKCDDQKCAHDTVAIYLEHGVTPAFWTCEKCGHRALSAMHRNPQDLVPSWEWYRPRGDELAAMNAPCRAHIENFGLWPRRISSDRLLALARNLRHEIGVIEGLATNLEDCAAAATNAARGQGMTIIDDHRLYEFACELNSNVKLVRERVIIETLTSKPQEAL